MKLRTIKGNVLGHTNTDILKYPNTDIRILKHPFKPVVCKDSKILILGSFPSKPSFNNNFFMEIKQIVFGKF